MQDLTPREDAIAQRLAVAPRRCGHYAHTDGSSYHLVGCDARLLDLLAPCECATLQARVDRMERELAGLRRAAADAQRDASTWRARAKRAEAVVRALVGGNAIELLGHVAAGDIPPPTLRKLKQMRDAARAAGWLPKYR